MTEIDYNFIIDYKNKLHRDALKWDKEEYLLFKKFYDNVGALVKIYLEQEYMKEQKRKLRYITKLKEKEKK